MGLCSVVDEAAKYVIWFTVTVAVAVISLLFFTKRRARLGTELCCGVPGIVSPVNLISGTTHKWIYVVMFGALSITVGATIFQTQTLFSVDFSFGNRFADVLAGVLRNLIWVAVLAVLYYPVFACVEPPVCLIGYITGLLYTAWLLVTVVFYVAAFGRGCTTDFTPENYEVVLSVLINVPGLICFIIILVWYIVQLVCLLQSPNKKTWKECYPATRVTMLLRKPNKPVDNFFTRHIYRFEPNFKYPLKFLAAIMVSLFVLWEGTVLFTGLIFAFVEEFPSQLRSFGYLLVAAFVLSGFFSTGTLLQMVKSVRQDILKASRGDPSVLPKDSSFRDGALGAAVGYPGFQIAFMFVAYIINAYLFFIPGLPIWIAAMFIHADPEYAGYLVTRMSVIIVWSVVTAYVQSFLYKRVFQTGESRKLKRGVLILTNRRLLNCFAYFLFFYNALLGAIPALMRLTFAVAPVASRVMRLDQLLYPKSIASHDGGYAQYVRFLYFETTVNNPVMHTFVNVLRRYTPSRATPGATSIQVEANGNPHNVSRRSQGRRTSKRARNLWFVAYTLLRNPQLQAMRVRAAPEDDGEYEDATSVVNQSSSSSFHPRVQVHPVAATPQQLQTQYVEYNESARATREGHATQMGYTVEQLKLNIDFGAVKKKATSTFCNLYALIVIGALALIALYLTIALATM